MYKEYTLPNGKVEQYWDGPAGEEPISCDWCGETHKRGDLETVDGLLLCEDCQATDVCKLCGRIGEGLKCFVCTEYEKGGGLE